MIEDRRRRDAQRLRRAQELADAACERQEELVEEMREVSLRHRNGPIVLELYRRGGTGFEIPDDVC